MGSFCSDTAEDNQNTDVNSRISKDKRLDNKTHKLLLLGPGGSGKSTFFKQLQTIHGKGFPETERISFIKHIHFQIIEQIQLLISISNEFSVDFPEEFHDCAISDFLLDISEQIQYMRIDQTLTNNNHNHASASKRNRNRNHNRNHNHGGDMRSDLAITAAASSSMSSSAAAGALHSSDRTDADTADGRARAENESSALLSSKHSHSHGRSHGHNNHQKHDRHDSKQKEKQKQTRKQRDREQKHKQSMSLSSDEDINLMSDCRKIELIWNETGIQNTFSKRHRFGGITDSTAYFLDKIRDICQPDYIPSLEDIIYCRHRTTGIIEKAFTIKQTPIRIFDVGGQIVERNKWIHCFENVTAVIYVSSLSGFNEVMYEREHENVMHDSLNLFSEVCTNEWFTDTSMILFLNKNDLFKHKVTFARIPITVCFPNYKGNHTYIDSLNYIKCEFHRRHKQQNMHDMQQQQKRQLYVHITCAIDTQNVERIFNDVQHLIVSRNLDELGI